MYLYIASMEDILSDTSLTSRRHVSFLIISLTILVPFDGALVDAYGWRRSMMRIKAASIIESTFLHLTSDIFQAIFAVTLSESSIVALYNSCYTVIILLMM